MSKYDYDDFYIESDFYADGIVRKTTEKIDWINKVDKKYEKLMSIPIEIEINCIGTYDFYFKYYKWMNQTNSRHSWIGIKKTDGSYEKIKPEINGARKTLKISATGNKTFCVFVNLDFYSIKTQNLANEFPIWTEARKNIYSNMQMFLNSFGREIENIEDFLKEIRRSKYIETMNENYWDWIYSYDIPLVENIFAAKIKDSTGNILEKEESIGNFFYKEKEKVIPYQDGQKLFSLKNYGTITIESQGKIFKSDPKDHQIWNCFDEMAMMFGIKRKNLEKNESLRERIIDTFHFISNSSKNGIINGIGRETNTIARKKWIDDNNNFEIYELNVVKESIRVDGNKINRSQYIDYEIYKIESFDNINKIIRVSENFINEIKLQNIYITKLGVSFPIALKVIDVNNNEIKIETTETITSDWKYASSTRSKHSIILKAIKKDLEHDVKYISRIKAYGIEDEKRFNSWIYGEDEKETKESIEVRKNIEEAFPYIWEKSMFGKHIWKDEIPYIEVKGKFDEDMESFKNKKLKLKIWRDMELWKSKNI